MNATSVCPGLDGVREYLLGRMSEAPAAAVEAHLAACAECRKLLPTVQAEDDLTADFRAQAGRPEPATALLDRLADDLRGRLLSPDATTPADAEAMTAATPSPLEGMPERGLPLAPPQQPDEIGRLGGYRILKELGRGGMGVVYQAEDVRLKRRVAVKAMLPALAVNPKAGQRFLREAQAMAAVEHDHIVRIYQVDEDRGVPFLAMEFLKGEPLDERLKRDGEIPLAEVLRIGREIAEGLAAAHAQGLIHRDIKPGNVWLEAPHGRVKILDFGLARAASQDAALTQQGAIVGTPAYMAPEQARGETVDGRCDLFSLGVVLYRLCTGRQPFRGSDSISTLMEVALHAPPSPLQINPDLPQELSDMVMKLLEKDPARRFAAAGEVVQALLVLERKLARERAVEERTEALTAAPRKGRRLPRVLVAMAAPLLLGLAGGLIAVATGLIRIQTPQGDYVIDTDDPDFFFQVHDGAVNLKDGKNNKTYTLKVVHEDKDAGEFLLEATDGDLSFKTKTFTIKRGDKVALTVLFEPKQIADGKPPPIADAFMQKVAALPADKQVEAVAAKLKELNPGFDGTIAQRQIDNGVVTGLRFSADNVTDLSPVRALGGLRWLTCTGSQDVGGRLADLAPLKDMKLRHLDCSRTRVSDLSPLKDLKLEMLYLSATKVDNLAPLKGMPLTDLDLYGTRVSDLAPLKDMNLTALNIVGAPASDLTPLKGMPIKQLSCAFDPMRDAAILRSLPALETINGKPAKDVLSGAAVALPPADDAFMRKVAALFPNQQVDAVAAELKARNPGFDGKVTPRVEKGVVVWLEFLSDEVTDIAPVRALAGLRTLNCCGSKEGKRRLLDLSPLAGMPLTELHCSFTQVSDLSPLKGMPLTKLTCDSTPLSDSTPLQGMPLTYLSCEATKVTDLGPLKGMPLTRLRCSSTKVSDLAPLKDMKLTQSCWNTRVMDLAPLKGMPLTSLDCDRTPVSDLSPLKDMKLTTLDCHSTKASDLSPLKGMPLKHLNCNYVPERDAETLRSIKTLEKINDKQAAEFWKQGGAAANPPVDDAWVADVGALPAEQQVEAVVAELKARNPSFDGKVTPTIENGVVIGLEFVTDEVTDISPVRALAGLQTLKCPGSKDQKGRLADLSPLKGLKLQTLICNATQVADLSPLRGMPLTYLACGAANVSDLSPLKGMPLRFLFCGVSPLSDLSPLKGLDLRILNFSYSRVTDLTPLKDMKLSDLGFGGTRVTDLSPLKGMPLEHLGCDGTLVTDLSPLQGMPLKSLSCNFDPKRDAAILRSISTLEAINGKPAADFWKDVDAMKP